MQRTKAGSENCAIEPKFSVPMPNHTDYDSPYHLETPANQVWIRTERHGDVQMLFESSGIHSRGDMQDLKYLYTHLRQHKKSTSQIWIKDRKTPSANRLEHLKNPDSKGSITLERHDDV